MSACVRLSPASIGACADAAVRSEIDTVPKPGLVGPGDPGSHGDMDEGTFRRSADALRPFWARFAALGEAGAAMTALRTVGLEAERAMLAATGGVNTHRGLIFGLGLLAASAGTGEAGTGEAGTGEAGAGEAETLGAVAARRWGAAILRDPPVAGSNGETVRLRDGAPGARGEAASGFPSVHRVGLPALRTGRRLRPGDGEAARVQCLFALIASVRDTNLLHRGGADGLGFAQGAASRFLAAGGVGRGTWRREAEAVGRDFVRRGLSPGGSADLLAMTLFADAVEARP